MNPIKNRSAIFSHVKIAVWERDGNQCRYCGLETDRRSLCIDHVVSVENGGSNNFCNLVIACRPCNHFKANDPIEKMFLAMPANLRIWWNEFLDNPPANPEAPDKKGPGRPAGVRGKKAERSIGYYSSIYLNEDDEQLRAALIEKLGVKPNVVHRLAIRELAARHGISLPSPTDTSDSGK